MTTKSEDEIKDLETSLNLPAIRNLLLPGLWMEVGRAENSDLEADISIDFRAECLIVKGYNQKTKKLLGFAITKGSIERGEYRAQFRPNVLALLEQVSVE